MMNQIADTARDMRCYSLDNDFVGTPVDADRVRRIIEAYWFLPSAYSAAKVATNHHGGYTMRVHSNLWFEFDADA